MSFEGSYEYLCEKGHYSVVNVFCDEPNECTCGAKFTHQHLIDETNGYDPDDPATYPADKWKVSYDVIHNTDFLGNVYYTQRFRYEPTSAAWRKIK